MNSMGMVLSLASYHRLVDEIEIEQAKAIGAMFWIVKSDDIEPRLEQFHKDFSSYQDRTQPFTVYK